MSATATFSNDLVKIVALLGASVVAVPLFRRLGLGSVLGYLAAGLLIGPFGLALFKDPEAILHIAELGVVMFLFVIGLEMRPKHLWGMRKLIFGLGALQILGAIALLWGVAILLGFPKIPALVGSMGFVMTSTAIVMQLLGERGDIGMPHGQKIVAILLFEDLLIVPLLAIVAGLGTGASPQWDSSRLADLGIGLASLGALVAGGLWLVNPLFRLLAAAKAREIFTAAALLVVLGAALLMELGGLSMAMGAFVAGVLLSGSSFRHQLEADIEPFRGLLLGLFFLGVGMSLNLDIVQKEWLLVGGGVLAMMAAKSLAIYGIARLFKSRHAEALDRASLMAQGGEFAFVLYATAHTSKAISSNEQAIFTAIVVLSMVLTPLVALVVKRFTPTTRKQSLDGVEKADGLTGQALMIGFGRFGQVASQVLLARGVDVTIIDHNADIIRSASGFGFKVYYGDGTRLDVLHASGAEHAQVVLVCVDDPEACDRIVALVQHHFPQAQLMVRARDRSHALRLADAGVSYFKRETLESALRFGEAVLRELGVSDLEAEDVAAYVRQLDMERLELERSGRRTESLDKIVNNAPRVTPLTPPRRESQVLNEQELKDRLDLERGSG